MYRATTSSRFSFLLCQSYFTKYTIASTSPFTININAIQSQLHLLTTMQLFHFIVPFISLLHVCLADYTPTPTRTPSPTRPFTVAAFLSPFPSGANGSISGVTMRAQGGSFWLNPLNAIPSTGCGDSHGKGRNCPPGNETVLWVDKHGEAWLVTPPSC